jgi:hypothetical protein
MLKDTLGSLFSSLFSLILGGELFFNLSLFIQLLWFTV